MIDSKWQWYRSLTDKLFSFPLPALCCYKGWRGGVLLIFASLVGKLYEKGNLGYIISLVHLFKSLKFIPDFPYMHVITSTNLTNFNNYIYVCGSLSQHSSSWQFVEYGSFASFARDLECSTLQKSSRSAEIGVFKCQVHPILCLRVRVEQ